MSRLWLTCESHSGTCLYNEASLRRLKSDPPRCIKHGALLFTDTTLNGLGRREARTEIDRRFKCEAA